MPSLTCPWPVLDLHSEDEDPEYKPLRMPFKDDLDDFTNSPLDDKEDAVEGEAEGEDFSLDYLVDFFISVHTIQYTYGDK